MMASLQIDLMPYVSSTSDVHFDLVDALGRDHMLNLFHPCPKVFKSLIRTSQPDLAPDPEIAHALTQLPSVPFFHLERLPRFANTIYKERWMKHLPQGRVEVWGEYKREFINCMVEIYPLAESPRTIQVG